MRIRRLGVIGAGTMGGGIAALAASAGIPVLLLDVPGPGGGADRNVVARGGVERAKKSKPAAFMAADRAALIEIGNTEDDLERLAQCDLVVEAIIEKLEPKQALYARLETVLPSHTIVASNTSSIPMRMLVDKLGAGLRSRFVGMHFFNPPRYLHLLEIIPGPETSSTTIDAVRRFSDRILGKGIVLACDVPGFVANRLGVFGMVLAIRQMEKHDLTIDEVDVLTGVLTGRSKSATFRTADLSGIDVIAHVTKELSDATGEDFALSPWVLDLGKAGRLGEKSGAGFYRRVGKEIQTLDWKTGEYAPQSKPGSPELANLAAMPLADRFTVIRNWKADDRYGAFVHEYLLRFSHYVLTTGPLVARDIPSIDDAMVWGYAWDAGPFAQMDLLGNEFLASGFSRLSLGEPDLLRRAKDGFFSDDGTKVLSFKGGYEPIERPAGEIRLADFHRPSNRFHLLEDSRDASLIDVGGGVAVLEYHSKLNTLGQGVIEMIHRALDRVERDGLTGLVIGNDDPRTFTAGADLMYMLSLVDEKDWSRAAEACRHFQNTALRIRQSPFPVVAAPFGLALGGGCEFSLYADRVQAHAELYMGLVEVGVGIIPAVGGTTELLFRFASELTPYIEADPFEAVRRAFQVIAMATTSTSALDARAIGYLRPTDRITMNRDRLIADAVARVTDLAPDYVPPVPRRITAMGKDALGNLHYAAWAMKEAGQISDHDVRIAHELAYVLTGGDGPPRQVTEQDLLDLEREAFLRLLGTKETQERIKYMLKTGKPLRN